MKPECTLSEADEIVACRAPSPSTVTLPEGGIGFSGSVPKVMVRGVIGSKLVHSTVPPAWMTSSGSMNRTTETVSCPPPFATIFPIPTAIVH